MSEASGQERLNTALRSAAARSAEATGGCTLIFGAQREGEIQPMLRAAAGFGTPDEARRAAIAALPSVNDTLQSGEPTRGDAQAAFGPRGSAGTSTIPLICGGAVQGVLVVATPRAIPDAVQQQLDQIAWSTSVILDHARLSAEVADLRDNVQETMKSATEKGDELLQLSEALFAQDIELLRSNERLSKIEKLKNDFIEKMSRELRTPLNSIIESTISVLAGENDRLSDTAKTSLRLALDEGTAFQRTLQNILDLWRIKQGELPIEVQEVNYAEVIEEAIFSVHDTLQDKPVTIEKEIDESLPKIRTDLAKVNQILFLLLDNAAKFTNEGEITISTRLEGEELVCSVRDTGIGICADDQEFLFEEFFQVDELCSTRYRGAGLGLTLVRDLLVLLDGECAFDSEAGKGTCVSFRIPVQVV